MIVERDGYLETDPVLFYAGGWWTTDIERAKRYPDAVSAMSEHGWALSPDGNHKVRFKELLGT